MEKEKIFNGGFEKGLELAIDCGKIYKKEYNELVEKTGLSVLPDMVYGKQSQKSKLLEILESPANKLIAVDLDGTLCEGKFWEEEPKPLQDRIDYINNLYKKGGHIIIWTARFPKDYEITQKWLDKHGVMYHGISMRTKIGSDIYIDDKAINVEDIFNS